MKIRFWFLKSMMTLFVLIVLLLPVSCVTSENVWIAKREIPADLLHKEENTLDVRSMSGQNNHFSDNGPLSLTVESAILMSLENNRSLLVERLNPLIKKTVEEQELAVFDPSVKAGVQVQTSNSRRLSTSGHYGDSLTTDGFQGNLSLKKFFPGGTFLEAGMVTNITDSDLYSDSYATTRMGLTVTQALLQGYGTNVNMARLRQSQLDTDITLYELRGFSESLLAQVENTYWDYALSQRQIEIVEASLRLARQQISETEEMIRVGSMAESELVAVQAEVATQQQGLIDAKSSLESNRLRLIRLLNPSGDNPWERKIILVHPPVVPDITSDDIKDHVAVALQMRPEINQARLNVQKNDIEIVRTRNGLLPRMDLFVTLGKTGYADSFTGSMGDMTEDSYDLTAGLTLEYPVFNRNATAQHRRALLNRDRATMALDNLKQIIELDVRNAYIELNRTREQISASTATRQVQEEKLRVEAEKFRVGRSTSLFVAQAQHDLMASRINEIRAVVNHLKAIVQFYRMEGSLLERKGIAMASSQSLQ